MRKHSSKTPIKKRAVAFLLALLMILTPVFTSCKPKPIVNPPPSDADMTFPSDDGSGNVDVPPLEYIPPEPEPEPEPELPPELEVDIPDDGEIELPPPIIDDGEYLGCPCAHDDSDCECNYTCLDASHSYTYSPAMPMFTYTLLNIAVAVESGEQLKTEILNGVQAFDGKGNDITDQIVITSIDDVPVNEHYDWDQTAAQFGTISILFTVTNLYGKTENLIRRVTLADKPLLSLNLEYPGLNVEDGKIVIYAGEEFGRNEILEVLSVTDRYDTSLNKNSAIVRFADFNHTKPGVYNVSVKITNAQNIESEITAQILVKGRPDPFSEFKLNGATHLTVTKTTGENLRAIAFDGVSAHDVVFGEIPQDKILDYSVQVDNGAPNIGGFAWNSLTGKICFIRVTFRISSDYPGLSGFSLTREITVVDVPELTIDQTAYDWKQLENGEYGFSVPVRSTFDIYSVIDVVDDSDSALDKSKIQIEGNVNTNSAGIYMLKLSVENCYNIRSTLTLYVNVELPVDNAVLMLSGMSNRVMPKGTGEDLRALIFSGLSAKDSAGFDLTDEITVTSITVNGTYYDCRFTYHDMLVGNSVLPLLNELAGKSCVLTVVVGVVDIYDPLQEFISVTRTITVAAPPVLSFDGARYGELYQGDNRLEIPKDSAFNYISGISVYDVLDQNLTVSDIHVTVALNGETAVFDTSVTGLYVITFQVVNSYGYQADPLTLYVNVVPPAPVITAVSPEDTDLTIAKTTGLLFQQLAVSGLVADDGEGGDITNRIGIYSVGGITVDGSFNWNAAAQKLGNVTVVLWASNLYDRISFFTRTIQIVDIPLIGFDMSSYTVESAAGKSCIVAYLGESFGYATALSIKDATDSGLTVADITVEGSVNTNVSGIYPLTFRAVNRYGVEGSLTVYVNVREKQVVERSGVEIYNIIQNKLRNTDYVATANGNFSTSWNAASTYAGMSTKTVNNSNTWSYEESYNGYIVTFTMAVYSAFNDLRRANQITVDKSSGTGVFKRDLEEDWYQKGFSMTGNLWGMSNGTVQPNYAETDNSYNVNNYENYFGRPLYQDSNFNVKADTINGSPIAQFLGNNRYSITFDMKMDGSVQAAGVKGRVGFLQNLQRTNRSFADASGSFARMTYTFDGDFNVISKHVQERYNFNFAASWYWFNTDFTEYYSYGAQTKSTSLRVNSSGLSADETESDEVHENHFDDNGNEYCATCGCCTECDVCFPKDEDGNIIGKEKPVIPVPIINFTEELVIRKGQAAENFKAFLLTGIEADDGFGNNALAQVRFYAIDNVQITSGFDWSVYANTAGKHVVTYYLINNSGQWILVEREFMVASVPKIEFVTSGMKVDMLPVSIGGVTTNVAHLAIIVGTPFDPLSIVNATDETDGEIPASEVIVEGSVNIHQKGIYTLVYSVKNSFTLSSPKYTIYFNVRDYLPNELKNGLEAYARIADTMTNTAFTSVTWGNGVANGSNAMVIYSVRQHSGNETYFENLSNGGKIVGVNADYAARVYRNGDSYRYSSAEGGFSSSNGVVTGAKWGGAQDWSRAQFEGAFGRGVDDLTNYRITSTSVTNPGNGIRTNGDGTFTIAYEIKIDNGVNSEGVAGYAKQIPTMSGGKTPTKFYKVTISMQFYSDYRLKEVSIYEKYEVDSGILGVKADMVANLTDVYSYPDSVTVTKF